MTSFALWDSKSYFCMCLSHHPLGCHLPKILQTVSFINKFWEPESQNSASGPFVKIPPFLWFGAPKLKSTSILNPQWGNGWVPIFCVLAFRTDRQTHTDRGQDPQSFPPSRASGTKPVGATPLPPLQYRKYKGSSTKIQWKYKGNTKEASGKYKGYQRISKGMKRNMKEV